MLPGMLAIEQDGDSLQPPFSEAEMARSYESRSVAHGLARLRPAPSPLPPPGLCLPDNDRLQVAFSFFAPRKGFTHFRLPQDFAQGLLPDLRVRLVKFPHIPPRRNRIDDVEVDDRRHLDRHV